ncbi:MAG: glutaredoxin family protein [Halieaceae bacterium]|uniref:glutaredoxin family protein n=1 Tax=Haliea alexandrii TaxID=2448162 RepID=UPI000F0B845F|nr:glutaredoxin family protein [Haliea alexandrii]MCR9184536.1 glutaredoxin family protein [Halieaceae bacterium]
MPELCHSPFTLYGTSACHLCEQASALLALAVRESIISDYAEVDISADDALFLRYGLRIPVLRSHSGRELDGPFSPEQLLNFLEAEAPPQG